MYHRFLAFASAVIPYLDVDSNLVYLAEPYFEADPDFQDCLEKIMPLKEDDKPSKVRSAAATYKTRHLNFFRKNVGN